MGAFISGLSSGIDWEGMVNSLMAIERNKVVSVEKKKTTEQQKLAAWQTLNTKLLTLKTAAENIKNVEDFGILKGTLTSNSSTVQGSDLLGVTVSAGASAGSYTLTVNSVATAHKVSSGQFGSASAALGAGHAGDMEINGKTVTVDAADTLTSLRDKINNSNSGVTATIVSYGADDHRLIMTSSTTGAAGISMNTGAADFFEREVTQGTDASLTLDGVTITRSENKISDVLSGVTFDLLKADAGTTVTLNVAQDVDAAANKINAFVTAYNDVLATINSHAGGKGVLYADSTLASIKTDLASLLTQPVWGASSEYSTMGMVGINVDRTGQLSVDMNKLKGVLETNLNDVLKLFTTQSQVSGPFTLITSGRESQAGEYAIEISQAATRSTSAAANSTSLAANETLTITANGHSVDVSLTAGMTTAEMVDAINSALSTGGANGSAMAITASADENGRLVLAHNSYGSGNSFTINSTTSQLWNGEQTVDNGLDVAGTINGQAATGQGQILTGAEGGSKGMTIRYGGTETGNIGTVTITTGVGEMYNQALYKITDKYDGYLSFRTESAQNKIKGYEKQALDLEARLEVKREQMLKKYAAMEQMLQSIQSQSSWLAAQTASMNANWSARRK